MIFNSNNNPSPTMRIFINGKCKNCGSPLHIICTMPYETIQDDFCCTCNQKLFAPDTEHFLQIARAVYSHCIRNTYLHIESIDLCCIDKSVEESV